LKRVKRVAFLVVLLVALASTALSIAASGQRIGARLTTRVEIPRPVGAKKASGFFTGAFIVQAKNVKLTWRLSFKNLSGRATGATLHQGKPGLIGTPITVLCKPCKSDKGATTLMRKSVAKALRAGQTYVTVYTSRNPAGEIRGQLRVKH
jgi:hypothetical protein